MVSNMSFSSTFWRLLTGEGLHFEFVFGVACYKVDALA